MSKNNDTDSKGHFSEENSQVEETAIEQAQPLDVRDTEDMWDTHIVDRWFDFYHD